ncbi:uncharacterized mitochondrial protein AtMg00810-like [Solanum lycopersicum]|uniref:uncharacterized mitochondrial protein AtMg00810-like n=1 Tax=Solanum lycopersicum TaxID=4081 RepID=UPI003749E1F0
MVEFDISDFGMMYYFLGLEVNQYADGIFVSQKKYVQYNLHRFLMENNNTMSTTMENGLKLVNEPEGRKVDISLYKQIIGSLMYFIATRPNALHNASLISIFMYSPRELHLQDAKRIMQYLNGTNDHGILYYMRVD